MQGVVLCIALPHVPVVQGVVLATGELAIRLDEERRRLTVARAWGISKVRLAAHRRRGEWSTALAHGST